MIDLWPTEEEMDATAPMAEQIRALEDERILREIEDKWRSTLTYRKFGPVKHRDSRTKTPIILGPTY